MWPQRWQASTSADPPPVAGPSRGPRPSTSGTTARRRGCDGRGTTCAAAGLGAHPTGYSPGDTVYSRCRSSRHAQVVGCWEPSVGSDAGGRRPVPTQRVLGRGDRAAGTSSMAVRPASHSCRGAPRHGRPQPGPFCPLRTGAVAARLHGAGSRSAAASASSRTYGLTAASGPICANPLGARSPAPRSSASLWASTCEWWMTTDGGCRRCAGLVEILGPASWANNWSRAPPLSPPRPLRRWVVAAPATPATSTTQATCTSLAGSTGDQPRRGEGLPRVVEEGVASHPGVADVAVVGEPDPCWASAPCVRRDPRLGPPQLADQMGALGEQELRRHQRPARIHFTDSLPLHTPARSAGRAAGPAASCAPWRRPAPAPGFWSGSN